MAKSLDGKNDYRQEQAAVCHRAATSASFPEVRRAFMELEQGWLQLIGSAPDDPAAPAVDQQKHAKVSYRGKKKRA
jgi:hypothetical protein